jgi:hypothetical protein
MCCMSASNGFHHFAITPYNRPNQTTHAPSRTLSVAGGSEIDFAYD